MPRPRQYESNAERQAAYRERRAAEEAKKPHALVIDPATREELAELLHQINTGAWMPTMSGLTKLPKIDTGRLEAKLHHHSYQEKYWKRNEVQDVTKTRRKHRET